NTIVLRDQHASRWHAEIYCQNCHWFLRDCDSVNGTRLNNQRIKGTVALEHGHEIRIGDTCLLFILEPSESPTDELPAVAAPVEESETRDEDASVPAPLVSESLGLSELDSTVLEPDELTCLLTFMDASLRETTAAGVVALALETVYRQVRATVSGFLS